MNETARPSLAELTANTAAKRQEIWTKNGWTDVPVSTFAVGKSGSTFAGSTGDKLHVVISTTHIIRGEARTTVASPCNSSDRRRAAFSTIDGLDTDRVTCTKCLKWLGK